LQRTVAVKITNYHKPMMIKRKSTHNERFFI
jgi:hypothetical protein